MSVKLIYSSKYANCKGGNNNMLIDWKAVLSDCVSIQELTTDEHHFNDVSDLNVEEDVDEESDDETENNEIRSANLSDNALKYFCGYVIHQKISHPIADNQEEISLLKNCSKCVEHCTLQNSKISAPSDWLTFFKNFKDDSDFGSLIMPNESFFTVCKHAFLTFISFFKKEPYARNIKEKIVQKCILANKEFFDKNNLCFDHRIKLVDFFVLVLLRKNCRWLSETTAFNAGNNKQKHSRMDILVD